MAVVDTYYQTSSIEYGLVEVYRNTKNMVNHHTAGSQIQSDFIYLNSKTPRNGFMQFTPLIWKLCCSTPNTEI